MGSMRRSSSAGFKRKVALAALRGDRTRAEVAGALQVHPHQVMMWKKQVIEVLPEVFSQKRGRHGAERQALLEERYGQIGRLKMELEWLKKKSGLDAGA